MGISLQRITIAAAAVLALTVAGTAYAFSERSSAPAERAAVEAHESDRDVAVGSQALGQDEDAQAAAQVEDDDGEGAGAARHAGVIATEFGLRVESVVALHQQGIGWGALFKLCSFARAMNVPVETLIASATIDANGEREFAFGELRQSMTPEQMATLDAGPKNFGQLVSASRKPDGARNGRGPRP